MIAAVLKVMVLGVIRDRGALAMVFLLPPAIFVIFAAIFSGTSGNEMRLKVSVLDEVQSERTAKLVAAIRSDQSLRFQSPSPLNEQAVREVVSSGRADVGLIIRRRLTEQNGDAPILVISDAGKAMTGPILVGHVQRLLARDFPEVNLSRVVPVFDVLSGGFSTQQRARISAGIEAMGDKGAKGDKGQRKESGVISREVLAGIEGNSAVSYYAGAIAVMFLLFSSMQGAVTLVEERKSGILDRLAVGPAGTDVIVAGKFVFLTLQGILQVGLIFIVAWLAYGVDVFSRITPWFATTGLTSAAAAALGLCLASACVSKQQANTLSSFIVLLCSAIGGSMVPRFLMPPWLQDIGWFTPNAWAIEAYHGTLWRGQPIWELVPSFVPLAVTASVGLIAAIALSRYRLRLG